MVVEEKERYLHTTAAACKSLRSASFREHIREITFGRSVRIGTLLPYRNASSGLGCRLRSERQHTSCMAAVVLSSHLPHSMWTYTLLDAFFS